MTIIEEPGIPCLSLRPPWGWFLVNGRVPRLDGTTGWKDCENRSWSTKFRGRVLIQVSRRPDFAAEGMISRVLRPYGWDDDRLLHTFGMAYRQAGEVVGSVEIVECVKRHDSPWFFGPYGFVLRNPRPFIALAPVRVAGRLGIFRLKPGDVVTPTAWLHLIAHYAGGVADTD